MTTRRVLYISKGGDIGGAHRQLLYLVTTLGRWYDPVVICTAQGEIVDSLRDAGIRTEVLALCPWRKMPSGVLRYRDAQRLVALACRFNPALIHASDMWLGNYLAWMQWLLGVPSVVHVRAPVDGRAIRKHRLRRADGLISISKRITRALRVGRIPARKVIQIEDAVDVERFRPYASRSLALATPPPDATVVNIGLVGRVEPAKRQLEFIEAAHLLQNEGLKRVRFFLIGETRDRAYCKRLQHLVNRWGMNDQLTFTGRREDMPDVLNALDVLVSLSGGSVMYEAMSCGICVVSAGFSKPEDSMHLQDGITGRVLPSREPSVLASVLRHLVHHPEIRHRLGAGARAWAREKLSYSAMVTRTVEFYGRL